MKIEKIKNYFSETIKFRQTLESAFLNLGERLKKIKDERLWEAEDYGSFSEFLMDAKITDATASRLISVFEFFVLKFEFTETLLVQSTWSALYEIKVKAESLSKERVRELVEKSGLMTQTDLRNELREIKHGRSCKHVWDEVHLRCCKVCGAKEKIYEA